MISNVEPLMKIAIIGSGIAAATFCHRIRAAQPDIELQVFEKSRGIGGRMSTRRRDPWAFDHGAPFFTARTESFQQTLKAFQSSGDVELWQPKVITLSNGIKPYKRDWFEPHFVASPTMNQLCKALFDDQPIAFEQTINLIEGEPGAWFLKSTEGGSFGAFDRVVSTAPAEQTQVIMQNAAASPVVKFDPCFTLLVKCEQGYEPSFDVARINDGKLKWLTWSHRKPGRVSQASLVAHATGKYSKDRFDDDPGSVQDELLFELKALLPTTIPIEATDLHRWRYATVIEPLGLPYWSDQTNSLSACGDWCLGNEVEHAFTSANELAHAVLNPLSNTV